MEKVRLLVELDVKPGEIYEFVTMFHDEFIARSRLEVGCEYYELWQDKKHPNEMTIIEVWSSQAHLDVHSAQEWFAQWIPKLEAAVQVPPTIRFMSSVEN